MRIYKLNVKNYDLYLQQSNKKIQSKEDSFDNKKISPAINLNNQTGWLYNYSKVHNTMFSFKGKPLELPPCGYVDKYEAINRYNKLSNGSYLNSHDEFLNPEYRNIRKRNLEFLDKLTNDEDKKAFISHYKNVTGFPNLQEVSKRIETEFVSTMQNAQKTLYGSEYEVLAAGYDETCSVGQKMALPGSDLDKAYIILNGTGNLEKDKEVVNKFSGYIWNKTDQRILSLNHDTSFPAIFTVAQIIDNAEKIEREIKGEFSEEEKQRYMHLIDNEYIDIIKAAEFNIKVSNYFAVRAQNGKLSKNDVKNFAYFIESFREGKSLLETTKAKNLKSKLESNTFYNYSNCAHMNSMKKAVERGEESKQKIKKRAQMQKEFDSYPISKQYEIIKSVIRYSCELQDDYSEYFQNDRDIKSLHQPLLAILTKGITNEFFIPIFRRNMYDGYEMEYAKDKKITLYQGQDNSILWVSNEDLESVEKVINEIDIIKRIEKFKNIKKIQFAYDGLCPEQYTKTNKYSQKGKRIYEICI